MLKEKLEAEVLRRQGLPLGTVRNTYLKWAGASLLCWSTVALLLRHFVTQSGVYGRILNVCVSLAFLAGAILATVIAILRYKDYRLARTYRFQQAHK
jgi:hypothetical protein